MKKLICLIVVALWMTSSVFAEASLLPPYQYTGSDPYIAEICNWLLADEADKYLTGDIAIPCPILLMVDDSDPQDILVWGIYDINQYEVRNTTLFCVSGGTQIGLIHLQEADGTYSILDFDEVRDGSYYAEDIDRIFGARPGLKGKLYTALDNQGETRLQFIRDFVNHYQLNITQMQDYGWPPVPLINAMKTDEADQIIHHVSTLGYSIDYDLRLFSYDRFDEDTEVLSGVGTLQGISIEMRKINLSMEDVITDLKQAMEQPVCETVPIGADSALAVLVRDAAEEASVRNFNYLVSQDDSCLLISTSNTMYSYIDAPVVPEADAAIDATVKTLKIDR